LTCAVLTILVAGGVVGILYQLGVVQLARATANVEPNREGKVPVLMAGQNIPAFTRVTRDHLVNPETKEAANFWLVPEQIPPGVMQNLSEIAGRVLKHDKRAGFFFTEDDFLPVGTRPGIVAGIPAGKRSITLDANSIQGVAGLRSGDRFDVIATVPPSKRPASARSPAFGSSRGQAAPAESRPSVQVVVEDGAVVMPVYVRGVPTTSHGFSGQQTSNKPVQEIVLAIAPEEVSKLTAMLAQDATLTAVARSGLPTDDQESRISIDRESEHEAESQTIELIKGSKRDQYVYPSERRS
jgi:Flp pilus assembly protein CpaB